MDGHEKVKIFGEEFNVKAKVRRIESFSAHGDRRDILNYVKHSSPEQLKNIFLVHGEPSQAESLIDAFRSQGYENVEYPAVGDSFEIN
jgi:metallo-beta-lactamase family protein